MNSLWGDSSTQCPYYDDATGMYFETESEYSSLINLRKFVCKICKENLHRSNTFTSHCLARHKLYICNLCLQYRNLYPQEQDLFPKEDLYKHISAAHKKCNLCNEQIFDDDHMTRHIRESHYACDLCPPGARPYFIDYNELQQHYRRKHFLCEVTSCLMSKHVVFKTYEGLKNHYYLHHPRLEVPVVLASFKGTEEEEKKEVRIVDMNDKTFTCPDIDQEEEKKEDFPALVRDTRREEKKTAWKGQNKPKVGNSEPVQWPSLPASESVPRSKAAKNALPAKNVQYDPLNFREIPASKAKNSIKASLRDVKLHKKNAWGEGPPDISPPKKMSIKVINPGVIENSKAEESPELKPAIKQPKNDPESRLREERETLKDMINLYKAEAISISELEVYCRNMKEMSQSDTLVFLKDNLSKKMFKKISNILNPKPKPQLIINPEPVKNTPPEPLPAIEETKSSEPEVWNDFYKEVVDDLVSNLRSKSMSVRNFIDRIKELIPYSLLSSARDHIKARIDITTIATLKKELESLLQQPKNPSDFPDLPGFNAGECSNAWQYELRDQINLYNKGILNKDSFISNIESILPASHRNSGYSTIRQFIKDKIMGDIIVQTLINNSLHSSIHEGFPTLSSSDPPPAKKKKSKWSVKLKL